ERKLMGGRGWSLRKPRPPLSRGFRRLQPRPPDDTFVTARLDLRPTAKPGGHLPPGSFHTRTVWSQLADTAIRPSAEKATLPRRAVCPAKVCSSCPVSTSHSRMLWSSPPDSNRLPSADTARHSTRSVWPTKARSSFPDAVSHSRRVLSKLHDTACLPS